jgi:hypothetical protein
VRGRKLDLPRERRWQGAQAKTVVIQEIDRITDPMHDKSGRMAFMLSRLLEGGISRRWVSPPDEVGRVYWEKDDIFDKRGELVQMTYYVDHKLRFDGRQIDEMTKWSEMYQEFVVTAALPAGPPNRYVEGWGSGPAVAKLQFHPAICHRRSGMDPDGAQNVQTYCFAQGIGKIYERTVGGDEEVLIQYDVPPCGKLPQ